MAYQCPKRKKNKDIRNKEAKCNSSSNKQNDFKALHAGFNTGVDWIIDSGASTHTSNQRRLFQNLNKCEKSHISLVDDSKLTIDGRGDIGLDIKVMNSAKRVQVKDVSYVPNAKANLLSVSQMTAKDLMVVFTKAKCKVLDADEVIVMGTRVDDLYKLDVHPSMVCYAAETQGSAELWHRRLGHLGRSNMKLLRDKHAEGLNFPNPSQEPCEICAKGKHRRNPFPRSSKRASVPLGLIHTDLCGPMEKKSIGGSSYFMTMIDDHSRKVCVYFLAHKSQALDCFREFKNMVENETNARIKVVRSDNGREYVNEKFNKVLKDAGIKHQTTIPHSPQQNGRAERMNQTIMDKARCLLLDANLDKAFWAEAVATAAYLVNRAPARALEHKTPEEVWSGERPSLSHLRVFGTRVLAHIPKQSRKKWDKRSKECIFLGYAEDGKGYRLFDACSRRVFKARDVIFLENAPNDKAEKTKDGIHKGEIPIVDTVDEETLEESIQEAGAMSENQDREDPLTISSGSIEEWDSADERDDTDAETLGSETEYAPEIERVQSQAVEEMALPRRSSRKPKPRKLNEFMAYKLSKEPSEDPMTREEALGGTDGARWQKAMEEEYDSLMENKTWELVSLPPGRKALDCKWVYKTKKDAAGKIERYKARLVARGFAQTKRIDYEDTYSPVVRYESIRLLLALAVKLDMDVDHLDVTTAFLQGDLKEEVYMRQPPGFTVKGKTTKVCKLEKAIYGLKQGSNAWNCKLHTALLKIGFERSKTDQAVYIKSKDRSLTIIAVYVDDLLLLSTNRQVKDETKKQLHQEFKIRDLGEVYSLLGMRIQRDRNLGTISNDQRTYIEQIIKRFNMQDSNPVKTPLDINARLSKNQEAKTEEEKRKMSKMPYREALGSLMYACQGTRPDVAYAVGLLSRFSENPGKAHWSALKRVFRYLKGTPNYKLHFTKKGNELLEGHCDADWAGDVDGRKSTTGYVFRLQGAAVSWKSKRQHSTALLTTEAEYMAMAAAVQEAIWLRGLLSELVPKSLADTTPIHCDNQSTIKLANNSAYSARSKHIDTRFYFVRDKVIENMIDLRYVCTDEMIADSLTKAVPQHKNSFCGKKMGLKL